MEKNGNISPDSETDGFITPMNNPEQIITDFNNKHGFKRCQIAERRLFANTPHSRGMITLRKINLIKVFCDELLLGEILGNYLTSKDNLCDAVRMSNSSLADSESAICMTSGNKIMDSQECATSGIHVQNQQSDCAVVVNMASLSISKQMPTFELPSKPDTCTDDLERELSGSFIHACTVRRENAGGALYDKQDSVVSSRPTKSVKCKKHTSTRKIFAPKKHSNLTLTLSDLPQIISADTNCDSFTVVSDRINIKSNSRSSECTGSSEQVPVISVFKIPTMCMQSKYVVKPTAQEPGLNDVSSKVHYSGENISMSSFGDCSFSPVQFTLPPESPQQTSVKPTEEVTCVNSEICRETPISVTELIPTQNKHTKVESSKRKMKDTKTSVAEVRNIGKSSKRNCVIEAGEGRKTRSAIKQLTQKCHVEELRQESAGSTSQMDSVGGVKSHNKSRRCKTTGKPEGSEKVKNFSEKSHDKVSECSAVTDAPKSKHVLTEDTAIMDICQGKIQYFETQSCETLTDASDGKMLTRKQRGLLKNQALSDAIKENKVASCKSQMTKKSQKNRTIEQSMVSIANCSGMSVTNETFTSNISQSDGKPGNNVLLKTKRALNYTEEVTNVRSRISFSKSTSKSHQSNRTSLPVLNKEDKTKRPNSTLSQRQELSAQSKPCAERNKAEIRLHFNPQYSLSDSNCRTRPKKTVSLDIHKQKEIALNVTEKLKVNNLQELCDQNEISSASELHEQSSLQVVENSSGVKMPSRQLRKRKINLNLTENVKAETLEISLPTTTHVKVVKQTKRQTKVTAGNIQEAQIQTLENIKKQRAKKNLCPELAADNEKASTIKKGIIVRQLRSEAADDAVPGEESPRKDKVPARKKPTKLKSADQLQHGEDARSNTKQASQKFVGAHCSAAGGVSNAVLEAVSIGARAFALFVRNGRTWKLNPLDVAEAEKFKAACQVHGILPRYILPHGSYLLNCGSSNVDTLQKSRDTLIHELQICEMLGLEMYNFHPGSACGKGTVNECLMTVAESINLAHEKTNYVKTVIENMSCQGQTVGGKFEELKAIIDNVKNKSRIGVCLDTCHAFAAGFDVSSEKGFNEFMESFDRIVGLHYLCAMHLNDSKGELGCHLDRHENIGKGHIGLGGFRCVMNDPRLNNIPMILETPVNDYAKEIRILCDLENI